MRTVNPALELRVNRVKLGEGVLYSSKDGIICLIGALLQALGIPAHILERKGRPAMLPLEYRRKIAWAFQDDELRKETRLVCAIMETNDDAELLDSERERILIELLAQLGVTLIFEGNYRYVHEPGVDTEEEQVAVAA